MGATARAQVRGPPPLDEGSSKYLDFQKLAETSEISTVKPVPDEDSEASKSIDFDHDHIKDLRAMLSHMYENVNVGVSKTEKAVGESVHHIVDALHHASARLLTVLIVFIVTLILALSVFVYIRRYEQIGGPKWMTKFCMEQNLIDKHDFYHDSDDEGNNTYRGSLPDELIAPSAFQAMCEGDGNSVFGDDMKMSILKKPKGSHNDVFGKFDNGKICTALTVTNPGLAKRVKETAERKREMAEGARASPGEGRRGRTKSYSESSRKSQASGKSRKNSASNMPSEFLSKIPSVKTWINSEENKFDMYDGFRSELSFGLSDHEGEVADIELYEGENFAQDCLK